MCFEFNYEKSALLELISRNKFPLLIIPMLGTRVRVLVIQGLTFAIEHNLWLLDQSQGRPLK